MKNRSIGVSTAIILGALTSDFVFRCLEPQVPIGIGTLPGALSSGIASTLASTKKTNLTPIKRGLLSIIFTTCLMTVLTGSIYHFAEKDQPGEKWGDLIALLVGFLSLLSGTIGAISAPLVEKALDKKYKPI